MACLPGLFLRFRELVGYFNRTYNNLRFSEEKKKKLTKDCVVRLFQRVCRDLSAYRENAIRSVFMSFGGMFLLIESFEVVTPNGDIQFPYLLFLLLGAMSGLGLFYFDGFYVAGYLKRQVILKNKNIGTPVTIKFGDLFAERGWKAVGVNDFFDSVVDDDLVSQHSLHGQVLNQFWGGSGHDWDMQVEQALRDTEFERVERAKGNQNRYAIGATAPVACDDHKFLFVALGRTKLENNETQAKTDDLIVAVRGVLRSARTKCANEPLVIPLMGSGLARVGIDNAILVDLILAAIVEETKQLKVTGSITIILPEDKSDEINLGSISRDWN